MFAKRLKTLANRLLAKRLVGETSINWYKGGTLTRGLTLLLAVTKDLAFFRLVTNRRAARVLSRIYSLGGKSRVAEGHELPRGFGGILPQEIFLKWIWAEMQSGAFGDTILRHVAVWALSSSRLDDFSDIVTYGNDNNIFCGGGGGSLYPTNTLPKKIWTSEHLSGVAGCTSVFSLKKQNKTNKQTNKTLEARQRNPRCVAYFHLALCSFWEK